ncbi:LysR family transcriptional regulator [Pseudomonas costantinii]|uniref:Transcriptional regulator n=1 Tax=Pseudomonas costantinii TaxID=168469 RepID=A0A1S2UIC5_9PSED|nr:LysR family transcriptional regulator [Pseudomonas costantinii]NVZ21534.1 LysR family transcriptional regulator [Pseudomonas costantinii]NVZ70418.1 LysR family transcriptional regulator [Pseudomonas costantinii]OIN45920.1 transcriptional regulator [Pseudomonas costantinii]SEE55269.1 DNA-binding transcriptional regulator, LysR family [Pseudomonas costantinii]
MNFTLRQLRYALAAAKHGNLTLAAEELHVSQPSISTAITELEGLYGQPLFVRQRGLGVSLTPFGRTVMAQAKRVLAEARKFSDIGREPGDFAGDLVLGCYADIAPYCLPQILRRLQQVSPRVTVDMREGGFEYLGKRLSEGTLELALTYDLGLPENMQRVELCQLTAHALLAADHPLANESQVDMAALSAYNLVVMDQIHSWQHILDLFNAFGLQPSSVQPTHSFEFQRSLVANGFGVALTYTRPFGDHSYDGQPLVCRPIKQSLPVQRIVLAYDQRYPLTPPAEAFKAQALAWFSERRPFSLF